MTFPTTAARGALVWLAFSISSAAMAAPAVTTIDDTLIKADGTPFRGLLLINWRSFEAPGPSSVPTNSLSVPILNGRLFVKLVPTTASPVPAYYSVRYVADGSVQSTEMWSVPQSDVSQRVRDVRITWPPAAAPTAGLAETITIADVEGLTEELEARPMKGQSFAPSRAAVIGPAGEIEAAAGSLLDCVRVDGTSGPCGEGGASTAGFTDGETPSGSVDGSNAAFTLAAPPAPPASLQLFRNGLLLKQSLDYTVSSSQIQFLTGAVPQTGDILVASYRYEESLTVTYGFVDGETPAGTVNGLNPSFTLAALPAPAGSLALYRNGVLQKSGLDFTVSGNVITFTGPSTPQPGDILLAYYRTAGN